ncbi:MAG: T9SS type A sorting domain-containing protein, partial [Bacteroidales bacterium]|nr:T9SS type A sorting domain-containing protein [Bacteroidales bacterium]
TVNGLPADKTIYFRMFVTGGINDGYSNVAARGNLKTNTRFVTFDPQNGEDLIFVPVETGNTVSAPEEPVNGDLDFGGWYRESSCVNEWNFATDIVTADITLYACWKNPNSINEVQAGNLSLYPNPTNNQVTLSGLQGNETIQIFDMTGRQALTHRATGNKETVFVGNLAKGVYLVRVTRKDFSVMLKLIVKN